jgi:hypothetical protein
MLNLDFQIMKKIVLFASIISGLLTFACKDPDKVDFNHDELLKCWTYSYEEATGDESLLFRPCDFMEFPVSHYRIRFTLLENNQASYLQLSPVDAHQMALGTWNYNDDSKLLAILNTLGDTVHQYVVNKIEADKLILKPN